MSFSKRTHFYVTRQYVESHTTLKPDDVCRTVHAPQAHQTPRARRGATHTPHRSEPIEIAADATSRMRTAQTSVRCVAADAKNAQARSPRRSHAQARSPRRSHAQARSPRRLYAQARSPRRLHAQARSPRMRRASCKSTLFMWTDLRLMAIKLASSRRLTKYASVRSYRTRM